MKAIVSTIFLVIAIVSPAFALDNAEIYKSGTLINVFVGFCALIVVAQLVPVLILILGFIKASVSLAHSKEAAETEATQNGE